MARLLFPTEARIAGPLLIDASQLEALDDLVDRHIIGLRQEREDLLDRLTTKKIAERLASHSLKQDEVEHERASIREWVMCLEGLDRETRSVTVYLPRGKEVQGERFAEVAAHPLGEQEAPLGFLLSLKVGEVQARVGFNEASWTEDLRIEVNPNDVEVAQGLFGAIRNWASDIEAPRWQQKWLEHKSILGFFLYLWVMAGLVMFPLSNWGEAGKNTLKAEARNLLSKGLNPSNQQRALELLLAIESDYEPNKVAIPALGLRYWGYCVLGAVILGAAWAGPKSAIGIWKGKQRVRWRRLWIRTVTVTVPALAATSIVLPWLLHWLGLPPPEPLSRAEANFRMAPQLARPPWFAVLAVSPAMIGAP